MSTYFVDAEKQALRATGVVEPAPVWEQTADGRRRPTDAQDRDESGVLLWLVEVMYGSEAFGRQQTVTASVLVPSPARPNLPAFEVIPFEGLSVNAYANRNGGGLRESWSAEGIKQQGQGQQAQKQQAEQRRGE